MFFNVKQKTAEIRFLLNWFIIVMSIILRKQILIIILSWYHYHVVMITIWCHTFIECVFSKYSTTRPLFAFLVVNNVLLLFRNSCLWSMFISTAWLRQKNAVKVFKPHLESKYLWQVWAVLELVQKQLPDYACPSTITLLV
jgi:hypothetical protein